jgi:membrane protein DedA with SNARE-associated domain
MNLLLQNASYGLIILVPIGTGSGLPLPEEVPVIVAGIASHAGRLNVWLALASCFVGAILGDCVMYAFGYHFGHGVFKRHPLVARHLTPEREQWAEHMIRRHGFKVFFLSRFLVGIRSPVYITAGILHMPFRRFLLIDLVCAGVVIPTFFGLGYLFSDRIRAWWGAIHNAEIAVTVVVAITLGSVLLAWYIRRRRREARIRLRWLERRTYRTVREDSIP